VSRPVERITVPGDPYAPYDMSLGFRVGDLLFLSGFSAIDRDDRLVGEDDFDAQVEQVFRNLGYVLQAGGSGLDRVVKVTVYLTDMTAHLERFRVHRRRWFSPPYPADATIGVAALADPRCLIEMDAIASARPVAGT
jgi:enamine deaminase RidA (YjgF/YER057c/UK114 family)